MKNNKISKNIKLLGLLNLFMDIKLYGAIAIIYFTSITGSMGLGMSIFSIVCIAATIFEFPTGILSDKIGRKKTVILGTLASLIYAILFAISQNYIILVIAALFEGLERALFSGNNEAMLYDTLKDENLEKEYNTYLGKTNSMYAVAGVVSALLGGILVYFTSFQIVMWLSVIPKVINLFIVGFLTEPKSNTNKLEINPYEHLKETLNEIKSNNTLKKQIFADSISYGIGEASYQFRSKFYEMVWPLWSLGIPSLLSNIGSFLGEWFSGRIIKKFGNEKVIIIGKIYSFLANTIAFITKNLFSPLILVSNSFIPTNIARNDISNKLYTDKHRASMASFKSLFGNLIYAIFAIIIGFVADNIGVVFTLVCVQVISVSTLFIYLNIFKSNPSLKN